MRAGDRWAFRRLLANVHGLVVKTADRHIPRYWRSRRGRRSEKHTNKLFFEDLVAEACGAVWRAVPGFDLDGGYRFWTYAQQRVAGAISDAARKWRRGGSGEGRLDRWLYSHPNASPGEVLALQQKLLKRPRVMAIEHPSDFVKIAASLLPKEFEITETHLMEIPDHELDAFIEFARQRLAERALGASIREAETIN